MPKKQTQPRRSPVKPKKKAKKTKVAARAKPKAKKKSKKTKAPAKLKEKVSKKTKALPKPKTRAKKKDASTKSTTKKSSIPAKKKAAKKRPFTDNTTPILLTGNRQPGLLQDLMTFEFSRDLIMACLQGKEEEWLREVFEDPLGLSVLSKHAWLEGVVWPYELRLSDTKVERFAEIFDNRGIICEHLVIENFDDRYFVAKPPVVIDFAKLASMKCFKSIKACEIQKQADEPMVADVWQLARFEKLEYLHIMDEFIVDWSWLSQLRNLKHLKTDVRRWRDLAGLENVPLQKLDIGLHDTFLFHSEPSDEEYMEDGRHVDVPNFRPFPKLECLRISYEEKDTSFVSSCLQLKSLNLSWNELENLSGVAGLINLEKLDLRCNWAYDLDRLSMLRTIVAFDISPLSKCTKLKRLHLEGRHGHVGGRVALYDISPLSSLLELVVLGISRTCVTDITPLVPCTKLRVLFMARMKDEMEIPLEVYDRLQIFRYSYRLDGEYRTRPQDKKFNENVWKQDTPEYSSMRKLFSRFGFFVPPTPENCAFRYYLDDFITIRRVRVDADIDGDFWISDQDNEEWCPYDDLFPDDESES